MDSDKTRRQYDIDTRVNPVKVFIAIAIIRGDGLYNLVKIIAVSVEEICTNSSRQLNLPIVANVVDDSEAVEVLLVKKRRDEVFMKDRIPLGFAFLVMHDKVPFQRWKYNWDYCG
ncbi:unnamed protein product [Arabis nemorensis]|uniref:Uncharacterized protein n=1 Tax=Arabis nemorensis TaxID=586526 RepID=A0A565BHQ9_9BRAS|nr:unnamed protein product [Arabis nemorensis]